MTFLYTLFSKLRREPVHLEHGLFIGCVLVYALTRLLWIDQYPVYFFADEGIENVLARNLIDNGFKDPKGFWLPMFFNAYGFQNPLVTVYFHAFTQSLFGVSVIVTRSTSAFITLTATIACAGILRYGFKIKMWWLVVAFLTIIPVWFLHSRTAFETASMVSFYAWFLFCYVLYRTHSPRFIYLALLFAALTFYSYGNGQLVIGATGLLLGLLDIRYHLKHWRVVLPALIFLAVLAVPYLLWRREYPQTIDDQLKRVDSYLVQPMPLIEKATLFAPKYWDTVSPTYWFNPNFPEHIRHSMKNYGHMPFWTFPLFLLGLVGCISNVRNPVNRILLVALLVSPIGAALTTPGVTRVLAFVLPAAILMTLGIETIMCVIYHPKFHRWLASGITVVLLGIGLLMLNDAVKNGALWASDYGLYGVQWGAKPLFDKIKLLRSTMPNATFLISPNWANGTDVFVRYFTPNDPKVRIGAVSDYTLRKVEIPKEAVFILPLSELKQAESSKKFKPIRVFDDIKYPNGEIGFYFTQLTYVDNAEALFAADLVERRKPITSTALVNGETITVLHSRLDGGTIPNLFDNRFDSLIRGEEANPLSLDVYFPSDRKVTKIVITLTAMNAELTAKLYAPNQNDPYEQRKLWQSIGKDAVVEWVLVDPPSLINRIHLFVRNIDTGEPTNVHVREIKFE